MSRKQKVLKYIDIDGPVMDGADIEKTLKIFSNQPQWLKLSRIDCLKCFIQAMNELCIPIFDAPSELKPFLIQYFQ